MHPDAPSLAQPVPEQGCAPRPELSSGRAGLVDIQPAEETEICCCRVTPLHPGRGGMERSAGRAAMVPDFKQI